MATKRLGRQGSSGVGNDINTDPTFFPGGLGATRVSALKPAAGRHNIYPGDLGALKAVGRMGPAKILAVLGPAGANGVAARPSGRVRVAGRSR